MIGDTWWGLSMVLSTSSMMWMGPMMIAAFLFTPEVCTFSGSGLQTQQSLQGFSTDFLPTRAVDRPVIFRARAALFWMLILVPALILLTLAAWRAAISIEVPLQSPSAGAVYLETLPGAFIGKTTKSTETITSPTGSPRHRLGDGLIGRCMRRILAGIRLRHQWPEIQAMDFRCRSLGVQRLLCEEDRIPVSLQDISPAMRVWLLWESEEV